MVSTGISPSTSKAVMEISENRFLGLSDNLPHGFNNIHSFLSIICHFQSTNDNKTIILEIIDQNLSFFTFSEKYFPELKYPKCP